MMILTPPPTVRELEDLAQAFRGNIPEPEFRNNLGFYNNWGHYLIGLRRGYQKRFLSEAYNDHSSHT